MDTKNPLLNSEQEEPGGTPTSSYMGSRNLQGLDQQQSSNK